MVAQWLTRSTLDRGLPPPADRQVIVVDARGEVAGTDGVPHLLRDAAPEDVWLGAVRGSGLWCRGVPRHEEPSFQWPHVAGEWEQPVAAALALTQWHRGNPTCDRCGSPTVPVDLGVRRRCTSCGALQFVRTDPAVIVAVIDPDDRLLLARQGSWAPGRHSVLAGFVEPGESLEQACWREVREESGVELNAVRYVGSQPWPVPRSLMTGFIASTSATSVHVDADEIESGAFVTRDEVRDALEDGSLLLPSRASMGRHLIGLWLAGTAGRP